MKTFPKMQYSAPHFIGTVEDDQTVAHVDEHHNRRAWTKEERESFGYLLAAAPELLAALQKAEWGATVYKDSRIGLMSLNACPVCFQEEPRHAGDCTLSAALKKALNKS